MRIAIPHHRRGEEKPGRDKNRGRHELENASLRRVKAHARAVNRVKTITDKSCPRPQPIFNAVVNVSRFLLLHRVSESKSIAYTCEAIRLFAPPGFNPAMPVRGETPDTKTPPRASHPGTPITVLEILSQKWLPRSDSPCIDDNADNAGPGQRRLTLSVQGGQREMRSGGRRTKPLNIQPGFDDRR